MTTGGRNTVAEETGHKERTMSTRTTDAEPTMIRLVSELVDAHADTMLLAEELRDGRGEWGAHYDYLRDLHRVACEALARRRAGGAQPSVA